jgi:preprotein translocase subunit YajC
MKVCAVLIAALLLAITAGYAVAQEEGGNVGKIITVGEDRIVVGLHDGTQMTFEVRKVKDGDNWIADRAQLAQIKTLKVDQMVHVKWVKGDGGHMFIKEMFAGPEDRATNGLVTGSVIAAGEGRVVIAKDGGGQVTLEPMWVRRGGKWENDPYHKLFTEGLEPGDKVVAMWDIDEGTHFVMRGIAAVDDEGQALALALLQAEVRESYNMMREMQDTINNLRGQINKLLEALKKKDTEEG